MTSTALTSSKTSSTPSPKVVLITGCSSGIGKATALRLQQKGFVVYASARKVESLTSLKEAGCHTIALDVDNEASMVAATAAIIAEQGHIDVLVNNAGYSQSGAIEAVSVERIRRQFETNVFGLVRLTQLVLPGMRERRAGTIINISSMGGTLTFPGGGYYHATKHALEAISDALRFEVRGFGIDVVVVQPGLIRSGFADAAVGQSHAAAAAGPLDGVYGDFNAAVEKATVESYEKGPLAKLAGEPDDVAAVIEKAITSKRKKARYTVTGSATLLMTQRKLLSDRAWDGFLRTSFPSPGAPA